MSCISIGNGFICGPDKFVDMSPFGSHVWMEWHNYLGPTFFRSKSMTTPIRVPSRKTWDAFKQWQSAEEGKVDKEKWHKAYMEHMMAVTKCDADFAKQALDAGMPDFDYTDDPTDAADEEMSYWAD